MSGLPDHDGSQRANRWAQIRCEKHRAPYLIRGDGTHRGAWISLQCDCCYERGYRDGLRDAKAAAAQREAAAEWLEKATDALADVYGGAVEHASDNIRVTKEDRARLAGINECIGEVRALLDELRAGEAKC